MPSCITVSHVSAAVNSEFSTMIELLVDICSCAVMMLIAPPSTSPAASAENRAKEFFAIDATAVLARYYTGHVTATARAPRFAVLRCCSVPHCSAILAMTPAATSFVLSTPARTPPSSDTTRGMHPDLLPLLACPNCGGHLVLNAVA